MYQARQIIRLSIMGLLFLTAGFSFIRVPAPVYAAENSQMEATTAEQAQPKEDDDDGGSIVGSFFRFVGEVISFPFKILGKAFDAIF